MSRKEPELVILMGVQASGKSTFYHEKFAKTHLRINLDMIWTRPREKKLFESCMQVRQSAVIDNTNLFKSDRQRYIPIAKEHGMRVIGYYFQPYLDICINRNEKRDEISKIPKGALISAYNKIEPPVCDEGFDELYLVDNCNEDFITEIYREDENQRVDIPQAKERILYLDFSNIKYRGLLCGKIITLAEGNNVNVCFESSGEVTMICAVGKSDTVLDIFIKQVLDEYSVSEKNISRETQVTMFQVKEPDKSSILSVIKDFPNIIVNLKEKNEWLGIKTKILLILEGPENEIYRFEKTVRKMGISFLDT